MGAMLGVVLSDNFNYFIFILGVNFIFKFLLISFWREKKHQFMVRKNLIITVLGGLSLLEELSIIVSRPYIQHSNDD